MSNEGNFRRRTVVTMVKDKLATSKEHLEILKTHYPKFQGELGFWEHERSAMQWFLEQLKTRKVGKI